MGARGSVSPLAPAPGVTIVAPEFGHAEGVRSVVAAAFGPGRLAKTSERVREAGARARPDLSRVAVEDGAVIGCCLMWSVRLGDAPVLFLGPLAVHPQHQHKGLGADLVRAAVAAADAAGERAVVLVGAAAFFEPLGFSIAPRGQVSLPGPVDPKRLLWRRASAEILVGLSGALSGFPDASPT